MRSIERRIVSAVIFSHDGMILQGMKHPKTGGVYVDCWHIPGGAVEDGEDDVTALIREVREEVGINLQGSDLQLADNQGKGQSEKTLKETGEHVMCHMTFIVYKATLPTSAEQTHVYLADDLEKYKWIEVSDLKNTKMTPPSIELFTRLGYL